MNQKGNNLKLNNSIKNDSSGSISKLQNHKKDKIILSIMHKYGVSYSQAEIILLDLIKNKKDSPRDSSSNQKQIINEKDNNQIQKNSKFQKNVSLKDDSSKTRHDDVIVPHRRDKNNEVIPKKFNNNSTNISNNTIYENVDKNQQINANSKKNVDSILEGIIPDYNKQISIKLDHVNLTFEVQNEKVDTLKERFIRTLKRDNVKKIKIHALKDISFQIYKGEKVGIIGYNGAGKSTLLNVITGIYPPDSGKVVTHGNISPLLSLGAGFDHNFSGRRNITLNGAVLGYSKEFLESKIDEIIEFSELGEFIDIPIKNYSSGMLAKLGFSIATSVNPDILIIDEILGVGDVTFAKKSADKMRSLMDGGTTVILVSHSIPQIRELCDKAIWIDGGRVRCIGEVNKVCDAYLKDAEKASNTQLANIQFR